MESRLWTNPPLKPNGTMDYARLTVAEICEDLTESLTDRILNSGLDELEKFLEDLPDEEVLPSTPPSASLVAFMEALLLVEAEDADFCSTNAHDAICGAIRELRTAGEASR